ncbi:hypothetical protein ACFE04_029292 [Oxalis oulophora]
MGLRRVEAEEEFDAPPETLYKLWAKTPQHIPTMTLGKMQAVELHGDEDWEAHGHGSVKTWNYVYDGKIETYKEKIETDDVNLKVTHVGIEGSVFKYYKSVKVIWQFKPKGTGTLTSIMMEYEKLSDDVPDAMGYLNFMVEYHKAIDSHLNNKA